MKLTNKFAALLGAILLVPCVSQVRAQDLWIDGDSSWFTAGNWSTGVPTLAKNTQINNGGTARINTGAAATTRNFTLGNALGDTGTAFINNGSTLQIGVFGTSGNFVVGDAGTGSYTARDTTNTQVNLNMTIGNQASGVGTVTLQDNSQLDIEGFLRVGDAGTGTLLVHGNSVIGTTANYEPEGMVLGNQATGIGSATFTDASTMTTFATDDIVVGNNGQGTLTIRDSAMITTGGAVQVGVAAGSTGSVDVAGNLRSTPFWNLQSAGNMRIGVNGTGTLDIHDGGNVLTSGNALIGVNAGSSGTVTVRNADSLWQIEGNLDVGTNGTGSLEIRDTAEVAMAGNGAVFIGRNAGSVGTLTVNGGTLDPSNIWVGGNAAGPGGVGELRIVNNGIVTTTNAEVWNTGTLSVDATYTLNVTGTLTFAGGMLNFVGDGTNFINNATLTNLPGPDQNGMNANVSAGNTATITGTLSGNGDLFKTGNGTLVLNEVGFYESTHVNQGTLVIANFSAFGFGDTDVNTGGTLRTPEGAPLTYSMFGGNLNVNGGTFLAQVGGTGALQHDLLENAGNIFLDPAISHLFVHRVLGYNPNNGDVVTIISGTTLTGQFSDAPQAFAAPAPNDFLGLIQPFADYGNINANSVDLVFGFAASFASVAKTPNQIATAEALDAALAAGCIIPATNVLGNVPINALRHAYDLIAPEELASMYEASFAQGMVTSLNLQHRMDDIRWGSTGFCADGFVIQDNHGYTKNDGKSVADKNPAVEETAPPSTRWGGFITGSGELTKVGEESENDPGAHGYQLNQAGFTMGMDYRVTDHWAVGLSAGYTHTHGDLVNDGRLNTDGGRLGLYSTYYTNGFYVDASASGGYNQYDTRRTAFLGEESGSTDGAEFNGMVAAGYDWKKGCWTFGPTASFEYDYVQLNSFTEGDTSLIPLHFPDQNQSAYRSNLGFRVAHEQVMKPGEGLTVVPELRASWRHDFGPEAYAVDSNFVGCDDTFTVHGPWVGRDSAVVDLGLTAYCTPGLSAYIFYDGQFGRDNYNNNGISGGFRVAF